MLEILFTIGLILIPFLALALNFYTKNRNTSIKEIEMKEKLTITKKKNEIEEYFDINKKFKRFGEKFNTKETILYFHCEKLVSKYYTKLIIFNKEYDLIENKIIKIKLKKDSNFIQILIK